MDAVVMEHGVGERAGESGINGEEDRNPVEEHRQADRGHGHRLLASRPPDAFDVTAERTAVLPRTVLHPPIAQHQQARGEHRQQEGEPSPSHPHQVQDDATDAHEATGDRRGEAERQVLADVSEPQDE